MAALGLHGEEGVEGNHSVDLGHGDVEAAGYLALHLLGQIAEVSLGLVQDVDQLTGRVVELGADLGNLVFLTFVQFYLVHN